LLAVAPAAGHAASPFDGRWTVTIRGLGNCDSGGSYSLRIRDGLVSYSGFAPVRVHGRVDRNGKVMLLLDGGQRWARAAGLLFRGSGGGTWRGQAKRRACAGLWRGQRK
jgi:hypothetical protein